MTKPRLSNHYLINPIEFSDTLYCAVKKKNLTVSEYDISKGVRGDDPNHRDDDRSICQMVRNANGLTKFKYHKHMIYVVHFANNAVRRLNDYSGVSDGKWGSRRTRSDFTEEKKQIGQSYLDNPHHSIFELLNNISNDIDDDKVRSYVVEIAYYFERINSKLLEYETERGII